MREERFKTICTFDPALDTSRMTVKQLAKFSNERDMKDVQGFIHSGQAPTIFHVREIPHDLWESFVAATDVEAERLKRAFMVGVERVDNVPQRDGVSVSTWTGSGSHNGAAIMRDEDLALFSPAERAEIGAVAYWHSFLPRRIASFCRLQPTSVAIWERLEFRSADANPTSPETTNEKPSAPEAPTSPNPDATGSDTAMPAAASA